MVAVGGEGVYDDPKLQALREAEKQVWLTKIYTYDVTSASTGARIANTISDNIYSVRTHDANGKETVAKYRQNGSNFELVK